MKKLLLFIGLIVVPVFILTGCTKLGVNNDSNSSNPSDQTNGINPGRNNGNRRPDFGQPDREADIRGIVKSIIGNEVDILKVDIGARRMASSTATGQMNTNQEKPSVSLTGGIIPGGGAGGPRGDRAPGGGDFGERSTTDRVAMIAKLKEMSTGEEKVIIPVGIKMLKSSISSTGKQPEMVEASLSDITSDKNITIWLNADISDKKVAEFVLIN